VTEPSSHKLLPAQRKKKTGKKRERREREGGGRGEKERGKKGLSTAFLHF
jgi:hypothetical protein